MFIYPKFNDNNVKELSNINGVTQNMLQNITVQLIKKNQVINISHDSMETAVLLVKGAVVFTFQDNLYTATRKNFFRDLPVCLHFSRCTEVSILALHDSEILIQSTLNENIFPPKIFDKDNLRRFTSCKDKWENTAVRDVITIIEDSNSPYSNLVLGEVLVPQGRWWSYIPHSHPHPEVYYYRFSNPNGFGACFIDEDAYTVKDGSAGLFDGGKTHAQVTAPGYPMYCAWMIRHLDGNRWIDTRIDDPRHEWLL
ncbi:MAG: 5-deoxy-glucuronate isomerase [Christensenellaceae bacterium]|jgi:5-deoxy-glucuronate isomerase|nr:5-deoxy-glucuronate isomerase [Christensenellaceae bacterium]